MTDRRQEFALGPVGAFSLLLAAQKRRLARAEFGDVLGSAMISDELSAFRREQRHTGNLKQALASVGMAKARRKVAEGRARICLDRLNRGGVPVEEEVPKR